MNKGLLLLMLCCIPLLSIAQYWETHWKDSNYEFTGSGGDVVTVTKTDCEEGLLKVTDPVGMPLPAFSPLIINPKDANGNDITDISNFPLQIDLRVRSLSEVVIGVLFRSDDGTSDFRTTILYDTVYANLTQWTDVSLIFSGDAIAGFNTNNLRDVWIFLDRGTENFNGDELYLDYISLGGSANSDQESPCDLTEETAGAIFEEYFDGDSFRGLSTSSTAGEVTTFALDPSCQTLKLSVTDPVNAPLPPFNAYIVNPVDADGMDITMLADRVNLSLRMRSAAAVQLDVLFRSGEGSQEERSARKTVSIPATLDEWTQVNVEFSQEEYEGFDPTDVRDVWFYLDRGTENFAGNEVYIDHLVVGGVPNSTRQSPCSLDGAEDIPIFSEYFQEETSNSISTTSIAGQVTNFTLDEVCETLQISVADPVNTPLPSFNAYVVNPVDMEGNDITNITDKVNVSMRVRSAEAVQMDLLFRSGGGSQEERSSRKSVSIPGNLEEWTDVYVEFAAAEFEGFDPADLRDFWFYLDRGTPNFPGNEFYLDHIVIGGTPNPANNSPCSTESAAQTWIENWDNNNPVVFGGAETTKLSLTRTDCEELQVVVTDPEGNPHSEFRPIVINPLTPSGSEITNISGNVQLVIRARSAAEVPIGVLFRSGDGSADFRTAIKTQNVAGTLEAWTTLTFEFTEEELGGFDPEDLVDFWIFLDRSNANFPGNELYFDYITIGAQLDTAFNSPCGLPDFVVSSEEIKEAPLITVYPNPVSDYLHLDFGLNHNLGESTLLRLYGPGGNLHRQQQIDTSQRFLRLDVASLPRGLYFLELQSSSGRLTRSIIKP